MNPGGPENVLGHVMTFLGRQMLSPFTTRQVSSLDKKNLYYNGYLITTMG